MSWLCAERESPLLLGFQIFDHHQLVYISNSENIIYLFRKLFLKAWLSLLYGKFSLKICYEPFESYLFWTRPSSILSSCPRAFSKRVDANRYTSIFYPSPPKRHSSSNLHAKHRCSGTYWRRSRRENYRSSWNFSQKPLCELSEGIFSRLAQESTVRKSKNGGKISCRWSWLCSKMVNKSWIFQI